MEETKAYKHLHHESIFYSSLLHYTIHVIYLGAHIVDIYVREHRIVP